jgi:hypothetical protein
MKIEDLWYSMDNILAASNYAERPSWAKDPGYPPSRARQNVAALPPISLWSVGVMEYWKNKHQTPFFSNFKQRPARFSNAKSSRTIDHHSRTPWNCYRHNRLSLIWPKGPKFLNLNNPGRFRNLNHLTFIIICVICEICGLYFFIIHYSLFIIHFIWG